MKNNKFTESKAENSPSGGVLVGKRKGQTIIHNKGTLSGYLVGKTHAEGGIKAINKSTGQPLEMQGGEVVITAPAVADQTKREFDGEMLTNREILSKINEKGGGVAFAKDGMEIPKSVKHTGASYNYGGKTMTDHDILTLINGGKIKTWKQKYNKKYGYNENDSHDLEEIAKDTGVSLKGLKQIYNKGIGAYKTNPESVRPNVKSKEQWAMARVYSAVMGGKASKVDANELKMNNGGRIDLERESKKGDHPARDLNNYNDVLDLDADGLVGAETGLYNVGGGVKELVEYITISNKSQTPYHNIGIIRFYNFLDFKNFIKVKYEKEGIKSHRLIFICVNNDDSFSELNINISKGNNTKNNFNPFTGSFNAFYKNIDGKIATSKFDWNFWGGVKTAKTTSSTTTISAPIDLSNTKIWIGDNPELSKKVQEKAFELGWDWSSKNKTPKFLDDAKSLYFWDDKLIAYSDGNKTRFDNDSKREIFESDLFPTESTTTISAPIDLSNTKIWIGDNPELSERVQELAIKQGWDWWSGNGKPLNTQFPSLFFDTTHKKITSTDNKNNFDSFVDFKEIFESDLFGGQTIPENTSETISAPIDLSGKKIWFGDNNDLKDKVLKLAYSQGFQANRTFDDSTKSFTFYNNNGKKKIYGWLFREAYDTEPEIEIFESDLFGIASTKTTSALPNIDLSNTKIWIGNNPKLNERVQERAFELGWKWNSGDKKPLHLISQSLKFWDDNTITMDYYDKDYFDSQSQREIFESDLFGTGIATPTSKPIDLTNTKIWIDNSALSEKVQKKAFELGWEWDEPQLNNVLDKGSPIALFFLDTKRIEWTDNKYYFDNKRDNFKEIFESDLFPTETLSRTSSQNKTNDLNDLAKSLTADLDKLVFAEGDLENFPELLKEEKDLENLKKLLPSFQQKKYAIERGKILKEIKRLHKKLTYEGFIKGNEENSSDTDLFTPQGLLDYYYTQATQNPTADLEPPCELPTPNGEKSKLPLSAYLNVRTQQFKNWFGDWEKAYETGNYVDCSKMIDPDTKEPKIYYHGVRKYVPNFGQFSNMGQGIVRPYGSFEPPSFPASFFAGEEEYAKFYGGIAENMPTPSADYKPFIYKVFLSVKNPISLLPLDFMLSYKDFMDYIFVAYGVKVTPNQKLLEILDNDITKKNPMWIYVRRDIGLIEMLKDFGYDALFQIGDIPTFLPNGEIEQDRTKHLQEIEYLTFYPNQVKSASVKKSFYFNFFNDIRFKKGGYVRI